MTRMFSILSAAAMVLASGNVAAADRTVTLAVDNMSCAACPYIVKQSLAKVAGVDSVVVSFEERSATVTYDDRQTTIDALTSATAAAGYPSRLVP